MPTEADTCRICVGPKLYASGSTQDQIAEQRDFTDGRTLVAGRAARRCAQVGVRRGCRLHRQLARAVVATCRVEQPQVDEHARWLCESLLAVAS
jgi:hypothetical protein